MADRRSEYFEKLRDPRWQKKRLEILNRDGFACRECHAKNRPLHVHHLFYQGPPWRTPNFGLLTLCEDCHEEQHASNEGGGPTMAKNTAGLLWDPMILFATLGEHYGFNGDTFQEFAYALYEAASVNKQAVMKALSSIAEIAQRANSADVIRLQLFATELEHMDEEAAYRASLEESE